MRSINSRIDHCDDGIMASVPICLPCLFQVDIHAGNRLSLLYLHESSKKLRILRWLTERIRVDRILRNLFRCERSIVEERPLLRCGRVIRLKFFRRIRHRRLSRCREHHRRHKSRRMSADRFSFSIIILSHKNSLFSLHFQPSKADIRNFLPLFAGLCLDLLFNFTRYSCHFYELFLLFVNIRDFQFRKFLPAYSNDFLPCFTFSATIHLTFHI